VPQQVLDRDLAIGRDGIGGRLTVRIAAMLKMVSVVIGRLAALSRQP
jgi:hypothetical protein